MVDKTQPIEVWCIACGCQMKQRSGKWGPFWGCSAYPYCKNTLTNQQASDQHDPPDFDLIEDPQWED